MGFYTGDKVKVIEYVRDGVAFASGLSTGKEPDFYGEVVQTHLERDDLTAYKHINNRADPVGKIVYYDKGAERHFLLRDECFEHAE